MHLVDRSLKPLLISNSPSPIFFLAIHLKISSHLPHVISTLDLSAVSLCCDFNMSIHSVFSCKIVDQIQV